MESEGNHQKDACDGVKDGGSFDESGLFRLNVIDDIISGLFFGGEVFHERLPQFLDLFLILKEEGDKFASTAILIGDAHPCETGNEAKGEDRPAKDFRSGNEPRQGREKSILGELDVEAASRFPPLGQAKEHVTRQKCSYAGCYSAQRVGQRNDPPSAYLQPHKAKVAGQDECEGKGHYSAAESNGYLLAYLGEMLGLFEGHYDLSAGGVSNIGLSVLWLLRLSVLVGSYASPQRWLWLGYREKGAKVLHRKGGLGGGRIDRIRLGLGWRGNLIFLDNSC